MSPPIVLIFGAGSNVGQAVAKAFAAKGYKVAVTARTLKDGDSSDGQLHIAGDLSDPKSVVDAFAKVRAKLGIPSVVVYNAYSHTNNPKDEPFAVSVEAFTKDLTVNTISSYAAAEQAVQGFAELPESASKTFIFTGNMLNTLVTIPKLLSIGAGKAAASHVVQFAADTYKGKDYKFYYADERSEEGGPVWNLVDGPAHAKHYVELAEAKSQGPWLQTFVKGIGYKEFPIPSTYP